MSGVDRHSDIKTKSQTIPQRFHFTGMLMMRRARSDDKIIQQMREAFTSCKRPVPFHSIDAGDFADGSRFATLISFLRDGNGILEEEKQTHIQIRAFLTFFTLFTSELKTVRGRSSLRHSNLRRSLLVIKQRHSKSFNEYSMSSVCKVLPPNLPILLGSSVRKLCQTSLILSYHR
jgi:hypothetical protein